MDTGLSPHLEAVLAANPGWTIGQNEDPPHRWEAVSHPRPETEVFVHAATLAELAIRLEAEGGAS